MRKMLQNNKGSILVQVLIFAAVIGAGFYFLTDYVISQKKQIGKTVNAVNLHFALSSTMDYVLFGIRQKYCFTDDGLFMNAPTSQCNLVHTGSVERLIMSGEQENFILQMLASGTDMGPVDKNKISLKSISRYIKIDSVTTTHPIFPVLQSLKNVKDESTNQVVEIDGISVTLSRDESGYLPRTGNEIYLNAVIELKKAKNSKTPLYVGSVPLTVKSQIVIYSREVGSFALLIPKDLHLDTTWDTNVTAGDISLHRFDSKGAAGSGPGLVFLSPVFVNQDIYLMEDTTAEGDASAYNGPYAAVTFADRVYLGNGWIKNPDGSLFEPKTAGVMKDRFWSDIPTFGGFLRGIENDGGLDKGLQVFAKIISGQKADSNLMSRCIERSQNLSSSQYLYKSELVGTLNANAENKFKYRLFLNNKNQFVAQTNPIQDIKTTHWGSGTATRKNTKGGPIMNMTFALNDRIVTAQLNSTSTVTIVPEIGTEAYRSQLEGAVNSTQSSVASAEKKLEELNTQLAKAQADLNSLKAALAEEEAKPVPMASPSLSATPGISPSATPDMSPSPSPSATPDISPSPSPSVTPGMGLLPLPLSTPMASPSPSATSKVDYQDAKVIASLKSQIQALQSTITQLQSTSIQKQQNLLADAQSSYTKAQAELAVLNSEPAKFVIEVSPVQTPWAWKSKYYGTYKDRYDISITATNVDRLLDGNGKLVAPSIGFLSYDGSYYKSFPIKDPANDKLLRYLNFNFGADKKFLAPPSAMSVTSSSSALSPLMEDLSSDEELDLLCEAARNAMASQAFGGASWNVDFSGTTRNSWNFAGDESSKFGHDPVFDKTLLLDAGANGVFKVLSIAKECVIASSASFITGFYTCDSLRIEAREKPLRIVGTFIVGKLKIDPSAYKAGITWSSIYHPQAVQELQAAGVLKSVSGAPCNAPKNPIWHPVPSIQEVADRRACNVISLRAKANPFQWTTVDPDCGLLANSSNTTCKHRLVRFFVVEQAREEGH